MTSIKKFMKSQNKQTLKAGDGKPRSLPSQMTAQRVSLGAVQTYRSIEMLPEKVQPQTK